MFLQQSSKGRVSRGRSDHPHHLLSLFPHPRPSISGGWRDAKTILTHYVQERDDAHRKAFDRLYGFEEESDNVVYG